MLTSGFFLYVSGKWGTWCLETHSRYKCIKLWHGGSQGAYWLTDALCGKGERETHARNGAKPGSVSSRGLDCLSGKAPWRR